MRAQRDLATRAAARGNAVLGSTMRLRSRRAGEGGERGSHGAQSAERWSVSQPVVTKTMVAWLQSQVYLVNTRHDGGEQQRPCRAVLLVGHMSAQFHGGKLIDRCNLLVHGFACSKPAQRVLVAALHLRDSRHRWWRLVRSVVRINDNDPRRWRLMAACNHAARESGKKLGPAAG